MQPLLDAVVWYLPSPLDVPPIQGTKVGDESAVLERRADDSEPFAALAFKIMSDPYVGKLTYFRVYSGTLKAGSRVLIQDPATAESPTAVRAVLAATAVDFTGDIEAISSWLARACCA